MELVWYFKEAWVARKVIHVRDSLTLAEDYKALDVSAASCYLHHYDGSVGSSGPLHNGTYRALRCTFTWKGQQASLCKVCVLVPLFLLLLYSMPDPPFIPAHCVEGETFNNARYNTNTIWCMPNYCYVKHHVFWMLMLTGGIVWVVELVWHLLWSMNEGSNAVKA